MKKEWRELNLEIGNEKEIVDYEVKYNAMRLKVCQLEEEKEELIKAIVNLASKL